jgi:hypothetical protein
MALDGYEGLGESFGAHEDDLLLRPGFRRCNQRHGCITLQSFGALRLVGFDTLVGGRKNL